MIPSTQRIPWGSAPHPRAESKASGPASAKPGAMNRISLEAGRRLLLAGQALAGRPPTGAGPEAVYRLVHRLGFVQLDSINVLARAHHLTLWSRMETYRPVHLQRLQEDRRLFEHWTHDASLIPTAFHRMWLSRYARYPARIRRHAWWRERLGEDPEGLLAAVRQHVERHGPVASKHVPGESSGSGAWWGWKPEKAALEYLWRAGELAVHSRRGFEKVYDLLERVLPGAREEAAPTPEEACDWACREALERLGMASPSELAAFWGGVSPEEARTWAAGAPARGLAVRVEAEEVGGGTHPALAAPDWEERVQAARLASRMRLLSPFDPVVRDRRRLLRLFGFDYRFEAFVPAGRRQHGYYVLPVLERDRFVARLDAKLHRAAARLEVKGLWWEPRVRVTARRREALRQALERLAAFVGASSVEGGP